MYKLLVSFSLVVLFGLNGSYAKVSPPYIQNCPGLKPDCLKKVIQETLPQFAKGIPELGVAPIDPLTQDSAHLVLPGNFKIDLLNGSMTGLRKCNIDSVTHKNDVSDIKMHCDLTIKGKYKANGRILIVSINGDGDAKIKIKNIILHSIIRFHDVVRDGVVYSEVKSYEVTHKFADKVSFSLTNLFQGSPELSEAVLLFLNQNWKQVVDEFGSPLVKTMVDIIFGILKKFFETIPKEELFVE